MDYLAHHGIKGQKHGVRRWQNPDGSLTPEGYPHYGYNGPRNKAEVKQRKKYAKEKQKELRQLNRQLRYDTIQSNSAAYRAQLYQRKSKSKNDKYDKLSKDYEKAMNIYNSNFDEKASKFNSTLRDLEDKGYAWKNTMFSDITYADIGTRPKKFIENYDDIPVSTKKFKLNRYNEPNATTTNRITVKDRSTMSEFNQNRYDKNKYLRPYVNGNIRKTVIYV